MGLSIRNPFGQEATPEELRQMARVCMADSMAGYSSHYIARLVAKREVPSDFVDRILDNVVRYPQLARIQKDTFLEALALERPDCEPILRSKAGDAWFEAVCKELVLGLPMKLLGTALGR